MILKDITLPNGAVATCHVLQNIATKRPFDFARLTVQAYSSEAAFVAGAPYVYTDDIMMPVDGVVGPLAQAAEAWLVADASPFAGGEIAVDNSMSLEAAQDRAWACIKRARDIAEQADFTCDGHVYQGDRERILGGVMAAKLASDAGQSFATEFTLSNNDPITLDAVQMMAVGMALLAQVEEAFARGRAKRVAIYATTSPAELDAITWNS